MGNHASVYESVTNAIISELERGVAPWVKPWESASTASLPYNATSQRQYSGVNILLLWAATMVKGYRIPAWLTFRQANALGGHVRKGEKATHIVYASTFTKTDTDPKTGEQVEEQIPFLRWYTVFNVEQTEGLPGHLYHIADPKPVEQALASVEEFIGKLGADVRHFGDRACYRPTEDFIALPDPGAFRAPGDYYATSLHEHAHWTGHPSRLNRDLSGRFGSESYAGEELVAELASAYLCASLDIPGQLQHAEYIGSWLKLLKSDKRAIFTAASKATQAAEYLHTLAEPETLEANPSTSEAEGEP
jgi:antirestriction protein ArdC